MIEKYFVDELKSRYPHFNVSENFYEAEDNILAVFNEGGLANDPVNEVTPLYPKYMIWISSSNWAEVQKIAYEIYKMFHRKGLFEVTNYDGITFDVFLISADSPPNRIGIEGNLLQYSINFSTTIREVV